jgi:2,4-dienoyl-CoA reductase-like NADH-dependent reductase (Old Yellow Enzyme family)
MRTTAKHPAGCTPRPAVSRRADGVGYAEDHSGAEAVIPFATPLVCRGDRLCRGVRVDCDRTFGPASRFERQSIAMPTLFEPLPLRALTFANRILVSPMCQYSSVDGFSNDWHFVHLASRAVGGPALVFTEASAVTPTGRISPRDLGIYRDDHVDSLARIVDFIHTQGTLAGMQLAHAGRKGSTAPPWEGGRALQLSAGGWQPVGPTDEPFAAGYPVPRRLTVEDLAAIVDAFRQAAARARGAGFDVIEVHAAHGYLIHEFLSPLVNTRTDDYGGSYDNRVRLCLEIVGAVRAVWPEQLPVFVRLSCTDWKQGGWDVEQSVELARRLGALGVDLIDCSSGGAIPDAVIPVAPGYQVGFAEHIRLGAGLATGAVGLITEPEQADAIVRENRADCVLLARELLRDPYWPLRAARELGQVVPWPMQYLRAATHGTPAR